jgi:hypothetical protein
VTTKTLAERREIAEQALPERWRGKLTGRMDATHTLCEVHHPAPEWWSFKLKNHAQNTSVNFLKEFNFTRFP